MLKSITAWKCRRELERMRQGFFHDDDEALRNNWHVLTVSVKEGRFIAADERSSRDGSNRKRSESSMSAGGKSTLNRMSSLVMIPGDGDENPTELNTYMDLFLDDKYVNIHT
jgi:hypothetical protein